MTTEKKTGTEMDREKKREWEREKYRETVRCRDNGI